MLTEKSMRETEYYYICPNKVTPLHNLQCSRKYLYNIYNFKVTSIYLMLNHKTFSFYIQVNMALYYVVSYEVCTHRHTITGSSTAPHEN
jgi:hypothetical protein